MSRGGPLGWFGQVAAWVVILAVSAVLVVAVLVPRLAGAMPYTVLTGSMQPQYPPGTLVVVKPVPTGDIRVGDVVTYQLVSGQPAVVTHRVVAMRTSIDGARTFTMQGDANDVPDEKAVRAVQVRGRLWYAVPYLGYVNEVLTGRQRQLAVYVVAGGLSLYALFMFAGAVRGSSRKKEVPA